VTLFKIYGFLLESYRASIKKRELDGEFILYRIYRPLSFPLSAVLIKLGFSANQVTLLSLVVLLIAAGLFLVGEPLYMMLGALSYALAFLLDFADGNIARFHNKPNYFGKLIDGFVDTLSCILFIAVAVGNIRYGQNWLPADVELSLSITVALAVVITNYFRIRVAYFLKESGAKAITNGDSAHSESSAVQRLFRLGNVVYKNLATSTPIVLLVSAYFNLLSLFLLLFVVVYVLLGLSEIIVRLIQLRNRLNIYRAY
jgi:phosphatidylglycerophosphate synthase